MIKLSVLICSTHTRRNTFLPSMLNQVYGQYEALSAQEQAEAEILTLVDNKKMMLGHKRNEMVNIAQGEYVVFVDDDDRISPDYIRDLLFATRTNRDVIVFRASVSLNGEAPKECRYSVEYGHDYNDDNFYYRIPNHICCVKRELALQVSYPSISYGEDSSYAKLLLPLLKSEHKIHKVLYYYDYNQETTETQQHMRRKPVKSRRQETRPPIMDIIILSHAKMPELRRLTEQTIESCYAGANGLPIRIIVLEQNLQITEYQWAEIYHKPEKFHYNQFANWGARVGSAEWIMIANNDLIFQDGWLHALMAEKHPVMSPKCPVDSRQQDVLENEEGYKNGRLFSGWCFTICRDLWKEIGGFDEDIAFWTADDSVIEQLKKADIKPMLVVNSKVEHLGSQTLKTLPRSIKEELTKGQVKIFNKKYGQNKFDYGI